MNSKQLRVIQDEVNELKVIKQMMCEGLDKISASLLTIERLTRPDFIYLLSGPQKENKNAK